MSAGPWMVGKPIDLRVQLDSANAVLLTIEYDGKSFTMEDLERLRVVSLSAMDRMILGDLRRKLAAIARDLGKLA